MDKSSSSLWRTFNIINDSPTVVPKETGCLIIGGGAAGISTAYWLAKNQVKKNLVVIEKGDICSGATGRNGGHMWPDVWLPDEEDFKQYSEDEWRSAVLFAFQNWDLVQDFLNEYNLKEEVEFKLTGALEGARFEEEAKELQDFVKKYNDFISRNKFANIKELPILEFWEKEKTQQYLHTSTYIASLYQKHAGQIWPTKFINAMLRIATELANRNGTNLSVITHTEVINVKELKYPDGQVKSEVITNKGIILADHVFYCTNAYTPLIIPKYKDIIYPVRGQVIVTNPIHDPIFMCNLAQNDGWEYMIHRYADHRIVVGGMRWKTTTKEEGTFDDNEVVPIISDSLFDYLTSTFPKLESKIKKEYEWTGIMGFVKDELPLIGPISSNCYIAAGFHGNGMSLTFAAGKAVADMISGKIDTNDFIKPLLPSRFKL